mgnify:CR=1 FL=1
MYRRRRAVALVVVLAAVSLVVFCVMGLAAYATMRGIVAVGRVATVDAVALSLPRSM